MKLTYTRPAVDWQSEAHPIGNGRLGAMCFGGVDVERLQVNESSLWTGDDKDTGHYQNLGNLRINFHHGESSEYNRSLDLARAIVSIQYTADGVRFNREYLASYPDRVLAFNYTANRPGAYNVTIQFSDGHDAGSVLVGNRISVCGTLSNGLAYETQILVIQEGGMHSVSGDSIRVENADKLTILLAARTNYLNDRTRAWRGQRPHPQVTDDINAAASKRWSDIVEAHVADHRHLHDRVSLDLGPVEPEVLALPTDKRLERYNRGMADTALETLLFQYGRYLLIASSRDALPANLQGLWNESNTPPWRCDYHSNINVQMNYWPAEVCNLSECVLPFLDYVKSMVSARRDETRDYYQNQVDPDRVPRKAVRGWTVKTENNIFGAGSFKWNPPGSAWYCLHFWEHYAFTGDLEYLRNVAYPILREVCEFWEDHLIALPDGALVTPDGWSPEHGPEEPGVTYDQEIVWNLFENFIAAAQLLGIDPQVRQAAGNLRDRLLKPQVGRWGQLQEWMDDRDDPKDKHRHVSHLFALHPGREIRMNRTTDLAAAARVSLEARGDESTGWAIAWRINFWARLQDGDRAHRLLRKFLRRVVSGPAINYEAGGGVYSNLLCAHPPFQIDGNFGVCAGMAEMLIQSHDECVHLLPALPAEWRTGSVRGLRARGGLVVSMTWKDGRLLNASLRSRQSVQCTVRYGSLVSKVYIAEDEAVFIDEACRVTRVNETPSSGC